MSITLNVERIILIILNLGWYLGLLCIKPVPENSREIVTISRDFPIPENSKSPGKITSLIEMKEKWNRIGIKKKERKKIPDDFG